MAKSEMPGDEPFIRTAPEDERAEQLRDRARLEQLFATWSMSQSAEWRDAILPFLRAKREEYVMALAEVDPKSHPHTVYRIQEGLTFLRDLITLPASCREQADELLSKYHWINIEAPWYDDADLQRQREHVEDHRREFHEALRGLVE